MDSEQILLNSRNPEDTFDGDGDANISTDSQLPPTDGGRDAWLFLAASFILDALVWGFPFSFGIFHEYYSSHEPFKNSGNIAAIGTCSLGIAYLSAPLYFALLLAFPRFCRWAPLVACFMVCLSLSLGSFSRTVPQLIVSQGIFYGAGVGLADCPAILYMSEWFVRRRGLAFGIMWAGTGISGIITPVVLQWLLNSYGVATTLRVWAVVVFILSFPTVYYIKPRLPTMQSSTLRPFNLSFLRNRVFMIFQLGNILEGLGYFLPSIYLPTYAQKLGASNIAASLTVMLFNLASVFGCVMMGSLVDRFHATTCILISTLGSVLSVFLIWGFSISLAPLYVFCVGYGLFAGSFSSTWPAIMIEVQKASSFADPGLIYGFLEAGRGIGNVISGPLSELLVSTYQHRSSTAGFAFGGQYGMIIVFTGITALLGGLSVVARPMRWV